MNALATDHSLLCEFAITPDAFRHADESQDSVHDYALVQLLRDIANDALLSDYHGGKWLEYIKGQRLPLLPQGMKDRVISCLSVMKARHRLVIRPTLGGAEPVQLGDWLNLAVEAHHKSPMDAIFVGPGCASPAAAGVVPKPTIVSVRDARESKPMDDTREHSVQVGKHRADYERHLAPVLAYAKWVLVVDPYMRYTDRQGGRSTCLDTLTVCAELLGSGLPTNIAKDRKIMVHTSKQEQYPPGLCEEDHYDGWFRGLSGVTSDVQVLVYLNPVAADLHERYILTDQVAISSGDSFECYGRPPTRKVIWDRLSPSIWRDKVTEYRFTSNGRARRWLRIANGLHEIVLP